MSFYTSNNVFIPGGNPGSILFVDPASPNPGAVTTDTFFRFDPTNDRLIIWGNIGAGIDIGTGNMRVSLTGNAGIGIGTQGGTSYFNIGTGPGAVADIRGAFSNLGIGGTSSNSLIDVSGEWNTTGTPTGIMLNVTDTASNANSLLLDLQTGGTTRFNVRKDGRVLAGDGLAYAFVSAPTTGIGRLANDIALYSGATPTARLFSTGFAVSSDQFIGFASGAVNGTTQDTTLFRDAANTLAQRNGVNAQTLRVYNTFTDASNYERGSFAWVSNELQIATQAAGTGSARSLTLKSANNLFLEAANGREIRFYNGSAAISWLISASSHFLAGTDNAYDIGAVGASRPRNVFWAGYQEMSEMTAPAAPAANSVRIYAEDNGSGKTRLMARFATGAAQQIAIEP